MTSLVNQFINDQGNGGIFTDGLPIIVSSRRQGNGIIGVMMIAADCAEALFTMLNVGYGYGALLKCEWFPYAEGDTIENALNELEVKLTKINRDNDDSLYAWVMRVSDAQWAATSAEYTEVEDILEEFDLSNGYEFIREMYRTGHKEA